MLNERIKYLTKAIAENSDQLAFDEMYRIYFSGLLSVAHSIIKDTHIAEEVVEDVFVKIWENRQTLLLIKNLSGYLYTATRHAAINYINSREHNIYRKSTVLDDIGDDFLFSFNTAENKLLTNDHLAEISAVINTLPSKCRLIFRLIKEEGLKYSDVAKMLGLSVKTVENQMTIANSRIMGKLLELFPEYVKAVS